MPRLEGEGHRRVRGSRSLALAVEPNPEGATLQPPRIAACLITKNSEATLERCLGSIRPHVDHIFVYDTGSTDGTVDLIERLNRAELWIDGQGTLHTEPLQDGLPHVGADWQQVPLAPITVGRGEWRDDFGWARQQSYQMIPAGQGFEWGLWLDDDDVVEGAQWLRQLAYMAHPDIDGFVFFYDYARDEHGNNVCQLWRERLVRLNRGFVWKGAVHEVLAPEDGRPPTFVQIPPEQVRYVHHRPPDRYPSDRNLSILLKHAAAEEENGGGPDPRTLAYIGTEHMARGEFMNAAPYLERYIDHPNAGWGDERSQVYHKLATCLRALGNPQAAVEAEMRALRERDDWAETHVGLSQAFAQLGQWDRAARWAKQALDLGMPRSALILNPLEFTLLPLVTLADAYTNLGRGDEARQAVAQAAAMYPGNEFLQTKKVEIERQLGENELVGAVLNLREVLVRHDENEKAWHLLSRSVPYVVAEHPAIVKARADQKEMVKHLLNPDEYAAWYREVPKESTVADEHVPNIGEHIPRAARLLEGLREQEQQLGRKPRLLDLGANDMWLACYLWKQARFEVDGIELNRQSYEKGQKRMRRFKAPGGYWHGDLHDAPHLANGAAHDGYDAVSLFEVIEHVPDIEKTLRLCERMLKPGGRIYLSTPNGAYERGQIEGWAQVERKGHLRAITVHDLCDLVLGRGNIDQLELQHDERVTFLSYTPKRKKSRIVFYAGGSWEPWSAASIQEGGLGGSETALVQVAARLAQAGHKVTVYSGAEPGLAAGALFRPFTAWDPTEDVDLLIVSRRPDVFDNPIGAKQTALWCHDHSYPAVLTEQRADKIDHVVVLSDWQRQRYSRLYPFLNGKLQVIRNGISWLDPTSGKPDRYPHISRPFSDRKPRCVYSSSADRGLDVMLTVWPRIREQVPDAELHVFYGWNVFDRVAMQNPQLAAYKQHVLHLADEAGGEDGGVFMRGRVGQRDLADEMMQARVWSYPTAFLETSCIGAMEARAAGLVPVTSDLGALAETVGPHGLLIPWAADEDEPHNQTGDYQAAFADQIVRLLTDETVWAGWHERAVRGVGTLDWGLRVKQWERLLPRRARKPAAKQKAAA